MRIRQLDPHVINQIAAGEVVDRPANVVKELVENAIDALATEVAIYIEDGGISSLKVIDNGEGISRDDLSAALASHATSKICDANDIDGVATLGFRGEALASIGAVSRLTLISKTRDVDDANSVSIDNGSFLGVVPAAHIAGTTVEVRRLFGSMPARKKFLKSPRSETAAISEIVRQIAIARPEIGISFQSGNRTLQSYGVNDTCRQRALAVLGQELSRQIHDFDRISSEHRVSGVIGAPELARSSSRFLHIVVNGRVIRDRSILHAVREGYRGLITPGHTPMGVLWIEVPGGEVDVNVHPQKTEVRFQSPDAIFSLVRRGVQSVIAKFEGVPSIKLDHFGKKEEPDQYVFQQVNGLNNQLSRNESGENDQFTDSANKNFEVIKQDFVTAARPNVSWIRLNKTFLAVEDPEGLLLIDQHALHERVLFEQILSRIEKEGLAKQSMVLPISIRGDEKQRESLDAMQPLLKKLSIDAESVGSAGILIHAFPDLLLARGVQPGEFVKELIDRFPEFDSTNGFEAALHEVLDMMACKAAIKAGDVMSDREISDLLLLREKTERSGRCPHGRPTSMLISIEDLERRFGRTPRASRR